MKPRKQLPASITSLSDKQLAEQLRKYNATVGPILPTTRRVYQKKLHELRTGEKLPPLRNYDEVANDEEDEYEEDRIKTFTAHRVYHKKPHESRKGEKPSPLWNYEEVDSDQWDYYENDYEEEAEAASPEPRQRSVEFCTPDGELKSPFRKPSPRRPLHSYMGDGRSPRSQLPAKKSPRKKSPQSRPDGSRERLPMFVSVLGIAIVAFLFFLVFKYMEPNPTSKIPELIDNQ